MTDADRRPTAIFLNLAAASARSRRVQRAVESTRAALDADLHTVQTRDPDELVTWMDGLVGDYGTIVVAGGDGSLSIAYNVLANRPDVALGYLPAGFGNATAHLLRLPADPDELAAVIAQRQSRQVDLVDASGRLALFAGVGWDAIVAERYADGGARGLSGWATAIARSMPELIWRQEVQVEVDGTQVHHGPMELLVVSTTPWYGRGLLVNPGARPDAGQLTTRLYSGPIPRFAVEAVRWASHRSPSVRPVRGAHVTVRRTDGSPLVVQADGDVIGRRTAWDFRIRPAAVRLIGRWPTTGGDRGHR